MTISDFIIDYYELSETRRKDGIERLFAEIARDVDLYDGLIIDILEMASDLEEGDYFGTEGLDI